MIELPIVRRLLGALFAVVAVCTGAATAATPLPHAHSHNDYEHTRPLFDALDQGFCSVEADIYLVDGKLLVAHNRKDVRPEKTLEALYLDPLVARCRAHSGHVYPELTNGLGSGPAGPVNAEFTLLVDIKSDGAAVYQVLRETLKRYGEMLTRFSPTNTVPGAVTIILSGDRPTSIVAAEPSRLCAIDGRFDDLAKDPSPSLVPLVSDSWTTFYGKGTGFTEPERARLRDLVARAHAQNRRVRLWDVPDRVEAWQMLHEAQVDLINTDDLSGLAAFLRSHP